MVHSRLHQRPGGQNWDGVWQTSSLTLPSANCPKNVMCFESKQQIQQITFIRLYQKLCQMSLQDLGTKGWCLATAQISLWQSRPCDTEMGGRDG